MQTVSQSRIFCPQCRARISIRGHEKRIKCYKCLLLFSPAFDNIESYQDDPTRANTYEETKTGHLLGFTRTKEIREYSYKRLVKEYNQTEDRGITRLIKIEAKQRPNYNPADFKKKRKSVAKEIFEDQDQQYFDFGNYTLPDFRPDWQK